ncbi:c-type cytochrome [Anaerobacillus sp. MEB173]|uniref:c-type cytochrome n=1 Tax=Anaerobacillus sp. MEB173 TaxID=3383345 RepID=UPI003F937561
MDNDQNNKSASSNENETLKQSEKIEPQTKQVEDMAEDIRMGDAKVPRFLIFTYVLLGLWAFGYALLAVPLNQVSEVSADGETIFSQSCFGCHNVTDEFKIGPGMQGVSERYSEEELQKILVNGIGEMPSLPALGLNTEQIKAVKDYIETL